MLFLLFVVGYFKNYFVYGKFGNVMYADDCSSAGLKTPGLKKKKLFVSVILCSGHGHVVRPPLLRLQPRWGNRGRKNYAPLLVGAQGYRMFPLSKQSDFLLLVFLITFVSP